jgi:hypothetical protein
VDDKLLAASGCLGRSGYYDAKQFAEKFGVDPRGYPDYFDVRPNGLVVVKPKYYSEFEKHFAWRALNWGALGIAV